MTVPVPLALLPTCQVWVDGARMADGCTDWETDLDPVVLTDLEVTWGRNNSLDQPDPGTCRFTVLDVGGGVRFIDVIHIGSKIEVRAEATIFPDPTVPIFAFDPGFEGLAVGAIPPSATINAVIRVTDLGPPQTGTRAALIESTISPDSTGSMMVTIPPAAFSTDTAAWSGLPQTKAGQTWQYGLSVLVPGLLVDNQQVRVYPVAFTGPTMAQAIPLTSYTHIIPVGSTGWQTVLDDFVPPEGMWLGLGIVIQPAGVRWDDVDYSQSWDSLGGVAVQTNLATNPTPGSVTNWATNASANWTHAYNATDKTVDVTLTAAGVTAQPNSVASWYNLGLPVANPVLTAGVKYQRSVEVWVDAAATLVNVLAGGFVGGQSLPAGQWTRVVEQFTGSGTAQYVMGATVRIVGATAGLHVKLRNAQLIVNPGGTTLPYFDGSTPDAGGIDYAWTGAANASTSTATDTRPAVQWDDIGRVFIDDLKMLAPEGGAARTATVFTGRVTDIEASYDLDKGGTVAEITAQTHLAELDNRYVGDVPWLAEPLASRFARIVSASGQVVNYQIDSTVQGRQITWRDVDSQPSGDLLHQLAQSVGGALWSAATSTGDAFVWLEDIDNRPAMATLQRDPDLVVRIHLDSSIGTGDHAITLDSCEVLLEPVRWIQTSEDDSTRVVVTWQEQTLDDKGNPDPTSRDYTVDNTGREQLTGRRRVQTTTQLATLTDAQILADSLMARLSSPGWRISGLTWDMYYQERVDADTLNRFMQILDGVTKLGLGLLLTNVPTWAPPATGENIWLFLEGGTYRNIDGAWSLELLTSNGMAQGAATVRWDDLPGPTGPSRTNLMYNPRATASGSAGWLTTRGFGTGGAGSYSFITGQAGPTGTGITTARRKTWTTGATNNDSTGFQVNADTVNAIPISSVAGKTVTVSAWMRNNTTTAKNLRMTVQIWSTLTGGLISTLFGTIVAAPTDGTWLRVSQTFAMPANAVGLTAFPDLATGGTNWAAGNTLDCTGLLVEEAGSVGAYFDGSTPDTATQDFTWTSGTDTGPSAENPIGAAGGWQWDQFDPAITWNALHGVGI